MNTVNNTLNEKIRLNKYLADLGICSRRSADEMIASGRILVNGNLPQAGDKVNDNDTILLDGQVLSVKKPEKVLIAYNKPVGIVCSTVNQGFEKNCITDAISYPERIYPIGRLDKDSEGLILLTNDGGLADEIMKADGHYEKEYEVTLSSPISDENINLLKNGVEIILKNNRVYKTKPCKIIRLRSDSFRIILREGKNRQIRRMCEAIGNKVISLKRIRIENFVLDDLKTGEYKIIEKGLL